MKRKGFKVIALLELSEQGGGISTLELMSFLCTWLRDHLAGADKDFDNYLQRTHTVP